MKILKLVIALFLILTINQLNAKNSQLSGNNSALGLKLNKSLTVAASEIDYSRDGEFDNIRSAELISGTIGLGADFIYKISSKSFLNISLIYSSYSINNSIRYKDNETLEASSFDFTINGNYYFGDPNGFTPYAGGGGGFIFLNSNENELTRVSQGDFIETDENDYLSELNLFFNAKIGLHIPITSKVYCFSEFDFMMITAENLGVIPKISVGASYWLE